MEASTESKENLLNQILPPRLEDAGLEDCALPPESIKEAFFKAAIAVKSRATSFLSSADDDEGTDGHCVEDPWPKGELPVPCVTEKGMNLPEFDGDEVVIDGEEERDKVKACVDGLQGLEIGEVKKKNREEDESELAEKPILGLGFA